MKVGVAHVLGIVVVGVVALSIFYLARNGSVINTKPAAITSGSVTLATSSTVSTTTILQTTSVPASIPNKTAAPTDWHIYVSSLGNFSAGSGNIYVINAPVDNVEAVVPGGISAGPIALQNDIAYGFALTQSGVSGYHNVTVFNYLTNQFLKNITLGSGSITALGMALAPNNKQLYVLEPECPLSITVNGGQQIYQNNPSVLQIIDISDMNASSPQIHNISLGSCSSSMAFSNGGGYLYVTNDDSNSIFVVNTQLKSVISMIQINYPSSLISGSNDQNMYAIGKNDNGSYAVYSINTKSNSIAGTVKLNSILGYIGGISPISDLMYVINANLSVGGSGSITPINLSTLKLQASIRLPTDPMSMSFVPYKNWAYVLDQHGTIYQINLTRGTIISQVEIHNSSAINVSPDGRFLYVAHTMPNGNGEVSVINTTSSTIIDSISVGVNPYMIQIYSFNSSSISNVSILNPATRTMPLTSLTKVYVGMNITYGQLTVLLDQLSLPDRNGVSAAAIAIYRDGILTNVTSVSPGAIVNLSMANQGRYLCVSQTYNGTYAYEKWAEMQLFSNPPTSC